VLPHTPCCFHPLHRTGNGMRSTPSGLAAAPQSPSVSAVAVPARHGGATVTGSRPRLAAPDRARVEAAVEVAAARRCKPPHAPPPCRGSRATLTPPSRAASPFGRASAATGGDATAFNAATTLAAATVSTVSAPPTNDWEEASSLWGWREGSP